MAIVYAVKSGAWSDPSVWNTGLLPGTTDEVYANGFGVYIDQDITVNSISTLAASGISATGGFKISWVDDDSTPETITITADILAGPDDSSFNSCLGTDSYHDGRHKTLVVNGNIHGGTTNDSTGVYTTCNLEVYGNVYAGGEFLTIGVICYNLDPLDIGAVYAKIVGNLYASPLASAVASMGVLLGIDGEAYSHPTGGSPIQSQSYGPLSGGTLVMTSYIIDYDNREIGDPVTFTIHGGGVGSDSPDPHDVRKGVAYDGSKVGTLDVPHPNQVAFGVPTDNTVGQAAISLPQLSEITGNQISSAFDK